MYYKLVGSVGLSLVDWYKDATSVPFGHLLIDLSPRTDDRLRYSTNSRKKPSKFYIPEQLKHLRILDDDHTKSLYSPSIPTLFPQVQNTISPKLPERIHSVPKRMYSEPAPRKFARFEKEQVIKYRKQIHALSLVRTTWKERRRILSTKKGLLLIKTISPFVISHLSWHGTVRACTNFRV